MVKISVSFRCAGAPKAHEKQRPDHLPIIEALLTAGAQVEPDWQQEIAELRSRASGKGEQS